MFHFLRPTLFPVLLAAAVLGPASRAGAEELRPIHPITPIIPIAKPQAVLPCAVCPTPAPAMLTAEWFTITGPDDTQLQVRGSSFIPGDAIEIEVFGNLFDPILYSTVATAATGGPCRTSNQCPDTTGNFFVWHNFGAGFNCGDTLDVAATDLTELSRLNEPVAPVQSTVLLKC